MIAAREYSLYCRYGRKVHRRPKIIKHALFFLVTDSFCFLHSHSHVFIMCLTDSIAT